MQKEVDGVCAGARLGGPPCSFIWGCLRAPDPKTAFSTDVLNCKREIPTVGVESHGLSEPLFFPYVGQDETSSPQILFFFFCFRKENTDKILFFFFFLL